MKFSLSRGRNTFIAAAALFAGAALSIGSARAQPGHDAFDKIFGYDNGREEQAAHNYLRQTGREDSYGESEIEPNQSNELNPAYNGQQGAQYQNQNSQRRYQNQQDNRQFRDQQNSAPQADRNNRSRSYSSDQNHGDLQAGQHPAHNLGVTWSTTGGRLTAHQLAPGGELAQEGMQQGDQIVSVGGQRVRSEAEFNRAIANARPGWEMPIVISRGGQRDTIYWAAQAGQQVAYNQHLNGPPQNGQNQAAGQQANRNVPPAQQQFRDALIINARLTEGPRGAAFLGVQLDRNRNDEAIVTHVYPDSPAQRAGLQAGDILSAVAGQQITTPADLSRHITQFQPGQRVQLSVHRARQMPEGVQPGQQRHYDESRHHQARNVDDSPAQYSDPSED